MELIQQALDKAKKQRDAAKEEQQNQVATEAKVSQSRSIATDEINYSQTQKVEISKNEMLPTLVLHNFWV